MRVGEGFETAAFIHHAGKDIGFERKSETLSPTQPTPKASTPQIPGPEWETQTKTPKTITLPTLPTLNPKPQALTP